MDIYRDPSVSEEILVAKAKEVTRHVFLATAAAVNDKYPGAYLQPLFKNAQKCKDLLLIGSSKTLDGQIEMFGGAVNG